MTRLEIAITYLRRIRSLDEKNVPKYAKQIAKDALRLIETATEASQWRPT